MIGMRTIVYKLVNDGLNAGGFSMEVFGAGAIREERAPALSLFAVIQFGITTPGVGRVKSVDLTLWVHQSGTGDYGNIDACISLVYDTMVNAEHVLSSDGSAELIQVDHVSTSGDLFDPGFGTLTKNIQFRLVGTGI